MGPHYIAKIRLASLDTIKRCASPDRVWRSSGKKPTGNARRQENIINHIFQQASIPQRLEDDTAPKQQSRRLP